MELGETLADCAVRETKEETGSDCEITGSSHTQTIKNRYRITAARADPLTDG